jgi:hypothetical protein
MSSSALIRGWKKRQVMELAKQFTLVFNNHCGTISYLHLYCVRSPSLPLSMMNNHVVEVILLLLLHAAIFSSVQSWLALVSPSHKFAIVIQP